MGIEPTYLAWKASVLPLNYTRIGNIKLLIGVTGFEPATPWSQTRYSSQTEPHPDPTENSAYACIFRRRFTTQELLYTKASALSTVFIFFIIPFIIH